MTVGQSLTTKVLFAKKGLDLARPIYKLGAFAHLAAQFALAWSVGAWSIDGNIDLFRVCWFYDLYLCRHVIGAVEAY